MGNQRAPFSRLQQEIVQSPELRKDLYKQLERSLGGKVRVVSIFTSFTFPVVLDDTDADMLEEVLGDTDWSDKELVLILNSPGGIALAAERIVNICRSFSEKGFRVIVPKMAKSAATMVCLGADEILMSKTSELGPIDPQILIHDENGKPVRYQAAHEIVDSYNELMAQANSAEGRIEPYLQQLARYDARDIRKIRSAQALSESIAVNLLKKGMLKRLGPAKIRSKIKSLLDPLATQDHGRPLFADDAEECGLNIRKVNNQDELWRLVWDLYIRLNFITSNRAPKIIESVDESYVAGEVEPASLSREEKI